MHSPARHQAPPPLIPFLPHEAWRPFFPLDTRLLVAFLLLPPIVLQGTGKIPPLPSIISKSLFFSPACIRSQIPPRINFFAQCLLYKLHVFHQVEGSFFSCFQSRVCPFFLSLSVPSAEDPSLPPFRFSHKSSYFEADAPLFSPPSPPSFSFGGFPLFTWGPCAQAPVPPL